MTEDCRQLCLCTLLSKSAVPPEHLQVLSINYELYSWYQERSHLFTGVG